MKHFGCVVAKNQEIEVIIVKKLHPLSDEGATQLALILLRHELEIKE